jgi:ATP-dependent DNA helicase RecQ
MAVISRDIRTLIDARDSKICQRCHYVQDAKTILVEGEIFELPSDYANPINIHHILPRQYGGSDDPSNLITLCRSCHMQRHAELQAKYFTETLRELYRLMMLKLKSLIGLPGGYDLTHALRLVTGSSSFRYPQKEIIENVLDGKNTVVVMPTGAGKSACFQVPGLVLDGDVLVISPLKSLMKDQVEQLQKRCITATLINGDLSKSEIEARTTMIRQGLFKFVYLTPERFFNGYNQYTMDLDNPLLKKYSLLVIDEAHCVEKWGRSFRQGYARLGELRQQLGNIPTIVLTASASKNVQAEIMKSMGIEDASVFVTGFYRPEIRLEVKQIDSRVHTKEMTIKAILDKAPGEKTIIFVPTIKLGNALHDFLKYFYDVEFYHSGRTAEEKKLIHNRFSAVIEPESKVLIATSAFGMGINIPNIRRVIHYSIPPNIEDYYQQVGRAGRDGNASEGILLYGERDEELIQYINRMALQKTEKSSEDRAIVASVQEEELTTMLAYMHSRNKWQYIVDYFGAPLVMRQKTRWSFLGLFRFLSGSPATA